MGKYKGTAFEGFFREEEAKEPDKKPRKKSDDKSASLEAILAAGSVHFEQLVKGGGTDVNLSDKKGRNMIPVRLAIDVLPLMTINWSSYDKDAIESIFRVMYTYAMEARDGEK